MTNNQNNAMAQKIQRAKYRAAARDVLDSIDSAVLVMAVMMVIFTIFGRLTVVDGISMEDTLHDRDFVFLSYRYSDLQCGDIIVCENKSNIYHKKPIVKRVIAKEGQVVNIDFETWVVTVDGKLIDEPYIKLAQDRRITSDWQYPYTVPENHIFVMGDNRNNSADSRLAEVGPVDVRFIVGKVIFRVLPFGKFAYFG
jgi:signal peptidase I, bacterial type